MSSGNKVQQEGSVHLLVAQIAGMNLRNIQSSPPIFSCIVTDHSDLVPDQTSSLASSDSRDVSEDLSAFAMPLIGSEIVETMADPNDTPGRSRSSSGSTALKSLLGSKSKSRNKSVEREDKKDKDKDKDKEKKKGFFEQFRPRSKSDVSGLKRPSKKSSLPTEHSMDESTLLAQANQKSAMGSQETVTPMSQILEGQMLNVPEEDRVRHRSGPSGYRDAGIMGKLRSRSNSESKPKSPKRTLQSQNLQKNLLIDSP